jgi:hypothetical protein
MNPARWTLLPAAAFAEHARQWDALNRAGPDAPLLNSALVESTLRHFGSGDERLAVCGDPDAPLALSLLRRAGHGWWQSAAPSPFAMGGLALWVQGRSAAPLDEMLPELLAQLPGLAPGVRVLQLDPRIVPRPADAPRLRTVDGIAIAGIDVRQSWPDYWACRGKNLRTNIKRTQARLAREGIEPGLRALSAVDDMWPAVEQHGALESAGWKTRTCSAIHIDNLLGRFFLGLLIRFACGGQARVYQLLLGDSVVASDLCVAQGRTLVILKIAYDELYKEYSPGMLLKRLYFERLFESGQFDRIEFYGRLMDWHLRWTDEVRTLYHVVCHGSGLLRPLLGRLRR